MERDRSTRFRGDPGTGQQFDNPRSFDDILGRQVIKARGRQSETDSLALAGKLRQGWQEGVHSEHACPRAGRCGARLVKQSFRL